MLIKHIPGYEGRYAITEDGRVFSYPNPKSSKYGKWLIHSRTKDGYLRYCLCVNKKRKYLSIHRLVAITFIDNHANKPQVNHINGNKSDNNVSNLEWCSALENNMHAIHTGLRGENPNKKGVICINTGTTYKSITDAANTIGLTRKAITNSMVRNHKCGGYHWAYI